MGAVTQDAVAAVLAPAKKDGSRLAGLVFDRTEFAALM
jgi:hypothetical protein